MNNSFIGERGAFTPSVPRTPGYYASPARSIKNTQTGVSQTPYTQTSPNPTSTTYIYTYFPKWKLSLTLRPPPDESSVERRILYGKIFTGIVSILFPSFFLSGFLWIVAVSLCLLIFGFLWYRDKGDYAVILGSFLLGVSLFYGTWPLWTSAWSNVTIKRHRGDSSSKTSYFHEEIVLDLRTYNEDLNTSEFLKDIAKTLELPEDSIRISKKYSGSDLSYVTITIVIVRKSSEARNSSYMEELRSRKNSEYLNRYKIVRVERAVSREEEKRLHERTIRPPPPPKSYEDEILGGDANVEVLVGPTITITGGGHICYGEKANITFSMDGTGPWTIVYNRGPPDYEVFQFKTDYSPYTIQTERPGIYTLGRGGIHEWVTPFSIFERTHIEDTPRDTYCPAVEMKGQVYVNVHPMPNAHFSKSKLRSIRSRFDKNSICEGEKQQLIVELEGTAPWSLAYSVLYGEEPFEAPSFWSRGRRREEANSWRHIEYIHNINKSPYVIDAEQSGEYRLLNISDSYCTNTKFTEEEKHLTFVHVRGLPKARISGGICQGDDITVTLLSGVIPWSLGYKLNNKDRLIKDINEAIYRIPTEQGANLNTYIIDTIHDKSCNGTIVDGPVTITPMQNPTARIYGGGPVLEGKTVDISIELNGKAPFSFTYALDDGNYITDTIVTDVYDNIYRIPVSKKGKYYLTSISDSQCGRGSFIGEALVSLYQLPSGFLKISRDSYCKGSDAPSLQFNVRGTPPFTIEYSVLTDSGDTFRFSQTNIEESPYITRAVDPGVYTFTSITDGYGNSVPLKYANTVTLKLSELPTIEWIDDTYYSCKKICEDETITLRAKLTGVAPWSISYTNGSQIVTESNIESSPHIISVSKPGNYRFVRVEDRNCINKNVESKSICVEQKPSPQCVIMLEHKHGSSYHACIGEEIKVKCNGTTPFKLVYYNGQRYTTKTSYDKEFTIPLTSIGSHTFSELTDASDCKGKIDIQVGEHRDRITQSITVDELPTVSLSTRQNSFTVCKGDSVDLPFIFTGKSPWAISYRYTAPSGIVSTKTKTNIMESSYMLHLYDEGVYQFLNVSDSNCASTAVDVSTHLITISYYTPPRVKFINKSKLCEGDTISMDFTGTPPYSFTYTVDGENARTESNIFSSPYIINAKPSGLFQIVRISDSRCAIENQDIDTVLVHPMPRANIGGGGTVCTGDQTNITINLTGTPPWTIKYFNTADNVERTERNILSSPHIIQTGKAGHYYLTAIADTYCHYERPKK